MPFRLVILVSCATLLLPAPRLLADHLVFKNGDRLSGTLVRADANGVIFQAAMVGPSTVLWSHLRRLRTRQVFVLITTRFGLHRGRIEWRHGQIRVLHRGQVSAMFLPRQLAMIINPVLYARQVNAAYPVWAGWHGALSAGVSLVRGTQSVRSFNGSVNLSRATPRLSWLPPSSKTSFAFQGNYGRISQTGKPTVLTDIFNSSLEQDEYISQRVFLFANALFNHNVAQGLSLQQSYGGGIGWTIIKDPVSALQVKSDLHWTQQAFYALPRSRFLATSLTESYGRKLTRAVMWTESLSVTPAITNSVAYQTAGQTSLVVPIYKSLSFNTTLIDNYLNNPAPGFQKNSLQFNSGIQFSL